jgi:hypothetical protein
MDSSPNLSRKVLAKDGRADAEAAKIGSTEWHTAG